MVNRLVHWLFRREVLTYLIAGVLATGVNLGVFTVLSTWFGPERWYLTNVPAIGLALLFAFFTNRWFVFRSKGPIWHEFKRFVLSRIFVSLAFEYGAMFVMFNGLAWTASIPVGNHHLSVAKVLTQFCVVVGNYALSKWFIFKHAAPPSRPGESR